MKSVWNRKKLISKYRIFLCVMYTIRFEKIYHFEWVLKNAQCKLVHKWCHPLGWSGRGLNQNVTEMVFNGYLSYFARRERGRDGKSRKKRDVICEQSLSIVTPLIDCYEFAWKQCGSIIAFVSGHFSICLQKILCMMKTIACEGIVSTNEYLCVVNTLLSLFRWEVTNIFGKTKTLLFSESSWEDFYTKHYTYLCLVYTRNSNT